MRSKDALGVGMLVRCATTQVMAIAGSAGT